MWTEAHEGAPAEFAHVNGPRDQEDRLQIEDDEADRDHVEFDGEPGLAVADGEHAALVGGVFDGVGGAGFAEENADEQGHARYVLGGVSMGAATALAAAVQQPGRVAGLILALPPTAWDSRPRQASPRHFRWLIHTGAGRGVGKYFLSSYIFVRDVFDSFKWNKKDFNYFI